MKKIKQHLFALGLLPIFSMSIADTSVLHQQVHSSAIEPTAQNELSIRELIEVAVKLLGPPEQVLPLPSLVNQVDADALIDYLDDDVTRIGRWLSGAANIITAFEDDNNHDLARAYYQVLNHVEQVLSAISETDPMAALSIVENSDTGETKQQLTHGILSTWSLHSPADALDWITQNPDTDLQEQFMPTVIYHWMNSDPTSALVAVRSLPRNHYTAYFMADYASSLAQSDPQAAYYWAVSLPNTEDRDISVQRVANEWAYSDTQGFLDFVEGLATENKRQLISENSTTIVVEKVRQDPFDALYWADTLDEDDRELARQVAFTSWFYENPEEALTYSQQSLDGEEFAQFIESIAYELPAFDLEYATQVFDNATVSVRNALAYNMVGPMVKADLNATITWIDALPRDNEERYMHSTAVLGLVQSLVTETPEQALNHLLDYQGSNRAEILREGFWSIALQEQDFASNSLEQAQLNDDEKAIFVEVLENVKASEGYHGC